MPATNYTVGYGSKVAWSTTFGGTYTNVVQTKDVSGPDPEVGDIKITNNDSPNNTHEYSPGMIEPGTVEYECVYTSTQQATLYGFLGNGIVYFWKETFADNSYVSFQGYLKKIGIETKTEDNANTAKITIKLTNLPVFTPHT